jgi:hypothetical protein
MFGCIILMYFTLVLIMLQLMQRADELAKLRQTPKPRTAVEEKVSKYVEYISTELVKIPDHLWTKYTMDHVALITSYVSGTVQEPQATAAPSYIFPRSSPPMYRFPTQSTTYQPYMYPPSQQMMTQPNLQQPLSQQTMMPPPASPSTSLGTGYQADFLPSPSAFTTSPGSTSYPQHPTPGYPSLNTPRMLPLSPDTGSLSQTTTTTTTVTTATEATSATSTLTSEVLSMLSTPDNL